MGMNDKNSANEVSRDDSNNPFNVSYDFNANSTQVLLKLLAINEWTGGEETDK